MGPCFARSPEAQWTSSTAQTALRSALRTAQPTRSGWRAVFRRRPNRAAHSPRGLCLARTPPAVRFPRTASRRTPHRSPHRTLQACSVQTCFATARAAGARPKLRFQRAAASAAALHVTTVTGPSHLLVLLLLLLLLLSRSLTSAAPPSPPAPPPLSLGQHPRSAPKTLEGTPVGPATGPAAVPAVSDSVLCVVKA